jgi:hypothetical protein
LHKKTPGTNPNEPHKVIQGITPTKKKHKRKFFPKTHPVNNNKNKILYNIPI